MTVMMPMVLTWIFCLSYEIRGITGNQQFQLPAGRFASRGNGGTGIAYGYEAIAITDRNSLAGIVRAHIAAKKTVHQIHSRLQAGSAERA